MLKRIKSILFDANLKQLIIAMSIILAAFIIFATYLFSR